MPTPEPLILGALMVGSEKDHLKIVKFLFDKGADVNAKNDSGYTALMYSSEKGRLEIVKFLVSKGADVNAKDNSGNTPLMYSVKEGQFKVIKFLIDANVYLNVKNKEGKTALIFSSENGDIETVKFLVDRGADVYVKDNSGKNALMWSSEKGYLEIVKFLKFVDNTKLMSSIKYGHLEIVKFLVNEGVDVNAEDDDGKTPLIYSIELGHLEIVKFLVDKGADVNAKDDDGNTALIYSSEGGHLEIVKFLVSKGADVNAKDSVGNTPLMICSDLEIVKFLVDKGADVNVRDDYGNTTLIQSIKYGDPLEIVKFLVSKGLDVNAENSHGNTALMYSSEKGRLEIVKFLVSKGANVNAKNIVGNTPLMFSLIYYDPLEIVKFLVSKGADVSAKNNSGKNVLMLSIEYIESIENEDGENYLKDVLDFLTKVKKLNFVLENINSECNASKLEKEDLLIIAKALNLTNVSKKNVCKKINDLFTRKSNYHKEKLDEKVCNTVDTLSGTNLNDVHPMFFYTIKEGNSLYCGDIREFIKLKKNPWTNTPFTKDELNRMKNEYDILTTLVKNVDDYEEVIVETIEMTLRRVMSNVLSNLSYPNSVEGYLNANSEKINLFIETLRGNILTSTEINMLNNITILPNKKLALTNLLQLKLDNDNTYIISGGNRVSALRAALEEVYNEIFETEMRR
jgi:ankyrin repeat protein